MTWPAALSGAALRVLRTAAGRRALQVVLLVGGLFALGFLCGQQAHAAEGVPAVTSAGIVPTASADEVRSSVKGGIERLVDAPTGPTAPPSRPAPPARPTAAAEDNAEEQQAGSRTESPHSSSGRVLRPVTDHVVRSVSDRVLRPVGDAVKPVTEGLTEVQAQVPSLPLLPPLPVLPSVPSLPSLPSLPGLPTLPALPSLPGQILPAPVVTAPQPAGHPSPSVAADSHGTVDTAAFITYGPSAGPVTAAVPAHAVDHRPAQPGRVPAHRAPEHDSNGVLGSQSALDGGSSRHGDGHAVTLNHQVPLRCVSGTAARTGAAGTRDRYRDIPVFPA